MDFDGKNYFFLIYFRPTSGFGVKRLVKNNKRKMWKTGPKQQNIHTFLQYFCQSPNLHQIHTNTKYHSCKYIFSLFQYKFIGFLPGIRGHRSARAFRACSTHLFRPIRYRGGSNYSLTGSLRYPMQNDECKMQNEGVGFADCFKSFP
jgi:hypothetical protein